MKVEIKQMTDLAIVAEAIRTCTDSEDKLSVPRDYSLIHACIKKGHDSVLEHCVYTFKLTGFSRAVLQELARHRIASLSVMSTRWALKKMLAKDDACASDFLVRTGVDSIDSSNMKAFYDMLQLTHIPNDKLKYMIPEAFKTKAMLTINLRSLRNLVKLRSSKNALWEFRDMVNMMFHSLTKEHQDFLKDVYYNKE